MSAPSSRKDQPYALMFAEWVKEHCSSIHSLSTLLMESSEEAENLTIQTFTELYTYGQQNEWQPILAYQCCIRRWLASLHPSQQFKKKLSPEDTLLCALWYGLKLPLPEISTILEKDVPVLKAQLRAIREQMSGESSKLSYRYNSPA